MANPANVQLSLWKGEDYIQSLEMYFGDELIDTTGWVPTVRIYDLEGLFVLEAESIFESKGVLRISIPLVSQSNLSLKRYLWECFCQTPASTILYPFAGSLLVRGLDGAL